MSGLCNIKSFIGVLVFNIAILGVCMVMISRGNTELPIFARELKTSFVKQHTIFSALNCPLDLGVLSVKTTDIWDSQVVKVTKHLLELCIRGVRAVKTLF